ncbi:hypothetical protein H9660_11895 [Clostridium sp. Sa3CUN1]|uniref:Uncharacterized protein n=1 Tax=Clostridium gallinarum TaxID=2762246 RepID=A0ABR8Q5Z3_9CLOT|nr:hypothetical protein [Clostridium gallinarum]MBD7915847.1 hypothetical protein [Clostridium gallinarum]
MRNNYDILSKNDIIKLRKAYKNYNISVECLAFDVKSIMDNEGVNKNQAINRILSIIDIDNCIKNKF